MTDSVTAHLLTACGVRPVRFRCRFNPEGGSTLTLDEQLIMRDGDLLDLGTGVTLTLDDLIGRES